MFVTEVRSFDIDADVYSSRPSRKEHLPRFAERNLEGFEWRVSASLLEGVLDPARVRFD